MRFLLDENFPLRLYRHLQAEGIECEHVIPLGLRGIGDAEIIDRLASEDDLVLLTQDSEFEQMVLPRGKVIISRVGQSLPIERRVEIWVSAIQQFLDSRPEGSLFAIPEAGGIERLPG